jgi:hypothetical protein
MAIGTSSFGERVTGRQYAKETRHMSRYVYVIGAPDLDPDHHTMAQHCRNVVPKDALVSTPNFETYPARHLKTSKRKRGNRKRKRGREPTIVIVFFHRTRTTIDGESSQKLNKIGKHFRQDVAFT